MRQVPNIKEDEKMERNIYRRLALITLAAVSILLLVPTQAEAAVLSDPPGRSSTGIDPSGDIPSGAPSFVDLKKAVISQRPDPTTTELSISVNGALPGTPPVGGCIALAWFIDADMNPATGLPVNDIGADFAIVLFGIGATNPCGEAPPIPVGVYSLWLFPFFGGMPVPLPASSFSISQRTVRVSLPSAFSAPPGITFFWVAASAQFPACSFFCDIAPDTGHVTMTTI